MTQDNKNLLLAVVLSLGVLILFQVFYVEPQVQAERARAAAEQKAVAAAAPAQAAQAVPGATTPAVAGQPAAPAPAQPLSRAQALAQSARVEIDSPGLDGSIALAGARFDALNLKRYRVSVAPDAPEVTFLHPQGVDQAFYSFFGWTGAEGQGAGDLPGPNMVWTAPAGAKLTPATPVTLTYQSASGLTFARTIAVDNDYMFTITDRVTNTGAAEAAITPYASLRRHAVPADLHRLMILHEGMIGVFDNKLQMKTYQQLEKGESVALSSTGGWFGITDKYWAALIVPDQAEKGDAAFRVTRTTAGEVFETSFVGTPRALAPGQSMEHTQRFYAGAKRVAVLQSYQKALALPRFEDVVDWGNFWFLTKPFFWLLSNLEKLSGSFAIGLLLTTVVVKILTFPLVYKGYEGMSKLRLVAPKMKEIQERFAADKARQQQEMMKLYQTEKINPLAGCLPMLIPIPIFYALYKMLTVTLEMRHAPFFGTWIVDMSAKDPTTIFNLFGLLPFDPTSWPVIGAFLAVGVLPILYGVSMWLLQSLQPPATDPMQQQILMILPFLFVFMFAGFAAGLVIYWIWSNILTIIQQYVIMHRMKVENPIDTFIARTFGKKASSAP